MCSQIFPHLTLLNQHKRTHNQEESDTVTVITQQPNIIQAQNIISDGQNLGQIQIVATDSLEPALHHTLNEQIGIQQQSSQKSNDKNKCITCGAQLPPQGKRKGPKVVRCESCIQNDKNAQNTRPTQIFVSPLDGDIKFEVNDSNIVTIPSLGGKKELTTGEWTT